MSNNSNNNFQQYQSAPGYNSFTNQPMNTIQLNNFNFSTNIRPLNTQYNSNLYRFGISTNQHVDQQIRQLQTDPNTGLPFENNSASKNPKEKYPPLISVLMLLEELSSKFSFGFDLYFQIDQKMMSFIASTALNEEDNSRQCLSQFDIIECIRQLSSSYDIFCLEEKDIFEIVAEQHDTSTFAQLVNLPYHFQITYASIYQNLKRQKQNLGSSQQYQQQQQQQQMYNSQGNYGTQQQPAGQQGGVQNQPYNQQGSNQYIQNQQGYGQQNNQQFNMQQQGGQNQQYQNMYPNQMQNYPQQIMKNQIGVDMNQIYQPNINQPANLGVQQQMPYNQQQMYYNQPQVKKERKKRTSNKSKQQQQQQVPFAGYGNQGQNDDQVYLSDQSQEDEEEEDEENDLGRASMVTKKIKKLSYVSRASQLQTFNEVKQYLEPFFSTPRSTSTLSRFFVVFSTEPRPGMDDPTAYLERLDEQMIRFVEKYKEHTGQELEMYKKDYDSENKRLYAFQNTEFYGTTRRSLYSKHISTVANLMSQNKKEKFAFAAKDVLIINGAQGVRTHDLANKIDISKRLAAKKFKKKEVIDEKKKNIEALKQQKKNQPKVFHNIIANLPTPKGEKTKSQKFFDKPVPQSSKQSNKSNNKSKEPKEVNNSVNQKKEKKVEKPKKEKIEKIVKQETSSEKTSKKDMKNKGGYNYNSQDTSYLSIKPSYNKLYAADKNFRSKRMQERQQKSIQLEDEKQIEQFAQQQLYGDSYLQGNSMNQNSQSQLQHQQYEQLQENQNHQHHHINQHQLQQQQQQQQQQMQQMQQHQNNNENSSYGQQGEMLEVEGNDNQQSQQQSNKNSDYQENQNNQQNNGQNGVNDDSNNYQQQQGQEEQQQQQEQQEQLQKSNEQNDNYNNDNNEIQNQSQKIENNNDYQQQEQEHQQQEQGHEQQEQQQQQLQQQENNNHNDNNNNKFEEEEQVGQQQLQSQQNQNQNQNQEQTQDQIENPKEEIQQEQQEQQQEQQE